MVTFSLKGNARPYAVNEAENIQIETNRLKIFGGKSVEEIPVESWFIDEDGDELTYSIVACDYGYDLDGTVALSESRDALIVQTKGFEKSNLVLRATDPDGAFAEVTVHFKTFNWWLVYGGIVIAVIIAVFLIIVVLSTVGFADGNELPRL